MSDRLRVYADTDALFPYYLSNLLLWLSTDGAIRLLWSEYLIEEVLDVVPRRWLRTGRGSEVEVAACSGTPSGPTSGPTK